MTGWLQVKVAADGCVAANTIAQYVTEARRLFWYARWIDTPISEWTLEEAGDYLAFLKDPDEAAICTEHVNRGDPRWRPFRKALSDSSAKQSQIIAGNLFKWLVQKQYLQANPFAECGLAGMRRRSTKKHTRFVDIAGLELARIAIAGRECVSDRQRSKQARDLFVLDLLVKTGLRTSEAIGATMGAIRYARFTPEQRARMVDAPEGVWVIDVEAGRVGQARTVSCAAIIGMLQEYRVAYGLPALPALGEKTPLILGARRRTPNLSGPCSDRAMRALRRDLGHSQGITNRSSLYRLIKAIFREALLWWDARDRIVSHRLEQASTHWLRHSFAKNLAAAGADPITLARNLGHSDINTSMVYIDDDETMRAVETGILIAKH
ncbi:tyrosine-type recombinase/integrase [Burkholderia diffusa]|uniref:tyrosine-type recombinase/integrase n=1 Tax=Burkholderia diffusa TaxID=488732 RepID=UPI00157A850A